MQGRRRFSRLPADAMERSSRVLIYHLAAPAPESFNKRLLQNPYCGLRHPFLFSSSPIRSPAPSSSSFSNLLLRPWTPPTVESLFRCNADFKKLKLVAQFRRKLDSVWCFYRSLRVLLFLGKWTLVLLGNLNFKSVDGPPAIGPAVAWNFDCSFEPRYKY